MAKSTRIKNATDALKIGDLDTIKRGVQYQKRIKSIRLVIFATLLASFIVFLALAAFAILSEGPSKFLASFESMNPYYFIAALIVIFVGYAMRFPKWELYLKRLKVKIPRGKNFMIYLSMYSMDITPGRWGRAVVSYTINKLTRVPFIRTFPAVVADIFTDFLGFAVLLVIATLLVQRFILLSIVITILLLIPFVFVYLRGPYEFMKGKFGKIKKLKSIFESGDMYFKYHKLLGHGSYAYSMLYTIPAMFLNGFALYLVILGFGINLPIAFLPTVIFIFTSSLILGMVTGIPATLGVTDAALVSYLTLFFPTLIGFGLASVITIVFRFATVWFVEGFGFSALLYTTKYWNIPAQHHGEDAKIAE